MGRKKIWAGSKNENWLGVNNKYENRQRYINGLILPVHQRLLRRKCRCCSLASCSLAPSTSRQQSQKSALSSTIQSSKGRRWGSSSISLSIIIETLLRIFHFPYYSAFILLSCLSWFPPPHLLQSTFCYLYSHITCLCTPFPITWPLLSGPVLDSPDLTL